MLFISGPGTTEPAPAVGIETIVTGLRWRSVQEPVICQGDWDDGFVPMCEELGASMAAGLEIGIF